MRFFKKINKFTLCVVFMRIFGYFISLVRFLGLFLANANLANANFFQNQKSH